MSPQALPGARAPKRRPQWRGRLRSIVVLVPCVLLSCVGSALGSVVEGSASDPSGDSSGVNDITQVWVEVGSAGAIDARVTFAGAPDGTGDEVVAVVVGASPSGGDCNDPGTVVVAPAVGGAVNWQRFDAAGNSTAQGTDGSAIVSGDSLNISVNDGALAGQNITCGQAELSDQDPFTGNPETLDSVSAFAMAPPAPKLELLDTLPVELGRGESRTASIGVGNTGDLGATGVVVRIKGSRGLTVSPGSWRISAIPEGDASFRQLRISLAGHGPRTASATVTVSGDGQRVSHHTSIGPPPPALSSPRAGQITGRYFWGTKINPLQGWDNVAIAFVNSKWAYRGFPPHGIPSCPSGGVARGSGDGCVRYSYNAATRSVSVGNQHGKWVSGGSLTLGNQQYAPLSIPSAGATFSVSLEQVGYEGICPSSCTTYTDYLQLNRYGVFSFGSQTIGTFGSPGGPFTAGSVTSGSQYGTYEVDRRGRLRLMFADGKTQIRTFAVLTNNRGRPDPAHAGLMLGSQNFYPSG